MNLKTKPLRLFALRDTASGRLMPDLYFSSKPDAKRERDKLGGPPRYCVTYGPDHRLFRLAH